MNGLDLSVRPEDTRVVVAISGGVDSLDRQARPIRYQNVEHSINLNRKNQDK